MLLLTAQELLKCTQIQLFTIPAGAVVAARALYLLHWYRICCTSIASYYCSFLINYMLGHYSLILIDSYYFMFKWIIPNDMIARFIFETSWPAQKNDWSGQKKFFKQDPLFVLHCFALCHLILMFDLDAILVLMRQITFVLNSTSYLQSL